ncbi:hypothetical protein SLS60_002380 [Paraconiothyrium brasiliense]|uniref:Heterokaryon incompatibility domain-containing protein n=1 Tax=Paraconiothyrium brasiliense TaxID=300254 RepID=A0ABR3S211_9PLEO
MSLGSSWGLSAIVALIVAFLGHVWIEGDACPVWSYSSQGLSLDEILPIPYTTLSSSRDSLRTLVLLPGSGAEPIRCELVSTQLSTNPSYEALSYQWEDTTKLKAILIDDVKVAITSNLAAALSSLRHRKEPRRLWVDAICINQQDDEEKARQVANMAAIYQRAQSVVVYLGEHEPYNQLHRFPLTDRVQRARELALKRFREDLGQKEQERQRQLQRGELREPGDEKAMSEQEKERALEDALNSAEHDAKLSEMAMDFFLRRIIHDHYWTRGWIIQEIVMAPGNLVVSHGSGVTTWDDFMQWVDRYHQLYPRDEAVKPILRLNHLRALRSRTGSVSTLASLLETFKDSFTSYHHRGVYHDKVYSLLGLAHDSPDGSFRIDYRKSAVELYKDCIDHFWNNSSMTPTQRAIELPYYAALVRRVLLRQPALRDVSDVGPRFNLEGARYEIFRPDGYNGISKNRGGSLFLLKLSSFLTQQFNGVYIAKWISEAERRNTKQKWYWKASQPEDASLWALAEHNVNASSDMHLRGQVVDKIEHVGKPYDVSESWSSEGLRFWGRDNGDSARDFVSANGVRGVAPLGARRGDLVCRFWNTNVLALVRKPHQNVSSSYVEGKMELVGRVAMRGMDRLPDPDVSSQLNAEVFGNINEKAVNIGVSLDGLTHLMTIDTIFWD